ncbi:hypothetical protein GCM10027256_24890 [Novispirillum itersonii subsp. nipponicum]
MTVIRTAPLTMVMVGTVTVTMVPMPITGMRPLRMPAFSGGGSPGAVIVVIGAGIRIPVRWQ